MPRMTDRFLEEIKRSHRYYAYVDVIGPDLETIRLQAVDGSVRVDGTAEIHRTCTIKCIDKTGELTPKDRGGILTPYGTEIRPYRGVIYDDGEIEVAPLGVFRLAKSSVDDSTGGSPEISIEGFDRSRTVARDKFVVPYVVAEGTNILDAIKDILERTYPDLSYDSITTEQVTTAPRLYDAGDDPWKAATELAHAMGCEIHFDTVGDVIIAPPVNVASLPAAEYQYVEGSGCTMLDLSRVYTDEPGFNGVVLTGESPGDELPPVRAEVWDEDPTSPTYRYGPYGEVPKFVTDQLVKTEEEAEAAAQAHLDSILGFSAELSITSWVNPALEAGNVVEVKRARSGVHGLYVVDAFSIPLARSGTQELTLRQKASGGGDFL